MSINYKVVKNNLTVPSSYTGTPISNNVLGFQDLAERINSTNPTITAKIAKSVLELFSDVVLSNLSEGNALNLEGFCSFNVSMNVKLDKPTDSLPENSVNVNVIPSPVLVQDVKDAATFSRIEYSEKVPMILAATNSLTGIEGWLEPYFSMSFTGTALRVDRPDPDQGVFLTSPAGNTIKQDNISLNNPSSIIFNPNLDPVQGPAGYASVEYALFVKAKYTPNGEIRTGFLGVPLRTTNIIGAATTNQLFVTGEDDSGPAEVSLYPGTEVTARIAATIKPNGDLTLSAGLIEAGAMGPSLTVTTEGSFVLEGLPSPLTIEVTNYAKLYQASLSYGRYITEFVSLSVIAPIEFLWVDQTPSSAISWNGVAFGDGLYVAVSSVTSGNVVMTSPDGENWTNQVSADQLSWRAVAYGNGLFVAVAGGSTRTDNVMTSPDGINWTQGTLPKAVALESIVFADGLFVTLNTVAEFEQVLTSPDGINWTLQDNQTSYRAWKGITYGNGLYVAVASNGSADGIMTSPDAINWTTRVDPADGIWNAVTFGDNLFVAVGNFGTGNRIITSPDGVTWTERTNPVDLYWSGVAYLNGTYVAVSADNGVTNASMTSEDGITWVEEPTTSGTFWNAVTAGPNKVVAVGNVGVMTALI